MPNRPKKITKRAQDVKKAPPVSKAPAKPEDPVAAFLARLGGAKKGPALDPARRREIARRAARMSSAPAAKAPGDRDTKKR